MVILMVLCVFSVLQNERSDEPFDRLEYDRLDKQLAILSRRQVEVLNHLERIVDSRNSKKYKEVKTEEKEPVEPSYLSIVDRVNRSAKLLEELIKEIRDDRARSSLSRPEEAPIDPIAYDDAVNIKSLYPDSSALAKRVVGMDCDRVRDLLGQPVGIRNEIDGNRIWFYKGCELRLKGRQVIGFKSYP